MLPKRSPLPAISVSPFSAHAVFCATGRGNRNSGGRPHGNRGYRWPILGQMIRWCLCFQSVGDWATRKPFAPIGITADWSDRDIQFFSQTRRCRLEKRRKFLAEYGTSGSARFPRAFPLFRLLTGFLRPLKGCGYRAACFYFPILRSMSL